MREGRIIFTDGGDAPAADRLDRFKSAFKKYRRLYAALTWLFAPLYFDRTRTRFIERWVEGNEGTFLNLGSGNTVLHDRIVNVDATPYDEVDLVCDIADLPLEDESIDAVLNMSVLEHVPRPAKVVSEMRRVLKPGGRIYTDIPFVVGYHASPGDFQRWTREGVLELHRDFETERLVLNGGPTSALLWVFQEWVALALSFGSRRLHTLIYLAIMALTFPFKFIDVALKHHPQSHQISSCFIYVGRKPERGDG